MLSDYTIIDLTHTLTAEVPTWNGFCGFCLNVKENYDHDFLAQEMNMRSGIGTHMDAPAHRIQGGLAIDEIPIEKFIAPCCVIDVSDKAEADYQISVGDVEIYEKTFEKIPKGALVIGYTGWSRFWPDEATYRNVDAEGHMRFPSFSAQAVEVLLKREIVGIAIDTLSPDPENSDYPVHQLILGSGKYIIENIADCSQIPPRGSYIIALPLRVQKGAESPIRMIALVPKDL